MKYPLLAFTLTFLFSCHRAPKEPKFHVAVVSFGGIGVVYNMYVIHATNDNWETSVDVLGQDDDFNDHHWMCGKEEMCNFAKSHVKNWDSVLRINARHDSSVLARKKEQVCREKMDTACIY